MKKFILAVALVAVASMAVISSASAGVERYQTQTLTLTAVQPENEYGQWTNVWTHTYTAELNPCDGSFSGHGSQQGTLSGSYGTQAVTGHLDGDTVNFTATRSDGIKWSMTGKIGDTLIATAWNADGTVIDTSPNALEFRVSKTTTNKSDYKNHGDYVKQAGDKADAAHSCIGMPIR